MKTATALLTCIKCDRVWEIRFDPDDPYLPGLCPVCRKD